MMSVNEDKPPITCAVLETHLKSINNIGLKKRRKKKQHKMQTRRNKEHTHKLQQLLTLTCTKNIERNAVVRLARTVGSHASIVSRMLLSQMWNGKHGRPGVHMC